jgi:hypothetical protein
MLVERAEEHSPLAPDDENRRLGNPALFLRVVPAPLTHQFPARVAKEGERQAQLLPQGFGALRLVHRDGNNVGAGGANLIIVVAVFRQLAKAKRSPMPAVEKNHLRPCGDQFLQPVKLPAGIGKLEIGRDLAHLGRLYLNRCGRYDQRARLNRSGQRIGRRRLL